MVHNMSSFFSFPATSVVAPITIIYVSHQANFLWEFLLSQYSMTYSNKK